MSGEHSHGISLFTSTDPVSDHTHAVSLTGTASGGTHNLHELDLQAEIEETTVQVSDGIGACPQFHFVILKNLTETVGAHHHDIEQTTDHGIIFGIYG